MTAVASIPTAGLPAPARLYQGLVVAGSIINRLIHPNPETLGDRLTPEERRALGVDTADPVIVIGGYASMPQSLDPLERSLRADGFGNVFVFEVPENGLADIRASAARLADFVAEVRRRTGAKHVDLVCHSAGGIVARTYAQLLGGSTSVDTIATIATPHHGIVLFGSKLLSGIVSSWVGKELLGAATGQLQMGSSLLRELDATRDALAGVRLVSLYVDGYDGLLTPVTTGVVDGADNRRLTHPGKSVRAAGLNHFTLHRTNGDVYELVRAALLADAAAR